MKIECGNPLRPRRSNLAMKYVMRIAGVLFLMIATFGCLPAPTNSPEMAYLSFTDALSKGDTTKAWNLLSNPTRTKAEERSKSISLASKGVVRDEPRSLFFQGIRADQPGRVVKVTADAATAVLKVASASGVREVKLINDNGKWFLDLSDSLEQRVSP